MSNTYSLNDQAAQKHLDQVALEVQRIMPHATKAAGVVCWFEDPDTGIIHRSLEIRIRVGEHIVYTFCTEGELMYGACSAIAQRLVASAEHELVETRKEAEVNDA